MTKSYQASDQISLFLSLAHPYIRIQPAYLTQSHPIVVSSKLRKQEGLHFQPKRTWLIACPHLWAALLALSQRIPLAIHLILWGRHPALELCFGVLLNRVVDEVPGWVERQTGELAWLCACIDDRGICQCHRTGETSRTLMFVSGGAGLCWRCRWQGRMLGDSRPR